MEHSSSKANCETVLAHIIATSRCVYKTFQNEIEIENKDDLYLIYTNIIEVNGNKKHVNCAINIKYIGDKSNFSIDEITSFVKNEVEKGSFAMYCPCENNNLFIFKIDQTACDEMETKDEMEIKLLSLEGNKPPHYIKVTYTTSRIKQVNLASHVIGADNDPKEKIII